MFINSHIVHICSFSICYIIWFLFPSATPPNIQMFIIVFQFSDIGAAKKNCWMDIYVSSNALNRACEGVNGLVYSTSDSVNCIVMHIAIMQWCIAERCLVETFRTFRCLPITYFLHNAVSMHVVHTWWYTIYRLCSRPFFQTFDSTKM